MRNKAVYVALGVRADGTKEILGLWLEQNEGAKFWLRVMNELKTRGVEDILIAIVDGLKGFPEAIVAVFPQATVQTCIVHLLRHSLEFASYKDRRAVAAALKDIYRAIDAASGEAALAAFEASPWGRKYPAIGQSWRRAWPEVVPFYAFHPDVRRLVYTTNAIEALNSKLRRAVRARGHFPTVVEVDQAEIPFREGDAFFEPGNAGKILVVGAVEVIDRDTNQPKPRRKHAMYRTRFFGQTVGLCGAPERLVMPSGASVVRASVAVLLD